MKIVSIIGINIYILVHLYNSFYCSCTIITLQKYQSIIKFMVISQFLWPTYTIEAVEVRLDFCYKIIMNVTWEELSPDLSITIAFKSLRCKSIIWVKFRSFLRVNYEKPLNFFIIWPVCVKRWKVEWSRWIDRCINNWMLQKTCSVRIK